MKVMEDLIIKGFQSAHFLPNQFPIAVHCDHLCDIYHVLSHWHEALEIIYFKEGCANVVCNKSNFICKPGDILFINSYSFHSFDRLPDKKICTYYCFSVNISLLESIGSNTAQFSEYIVTNNPQIEYALNTIINEKFNSTDYSPLIMEMQMICVLSYFLRIESKKQTTKITGNKKLIQYGKIRTAIDYIHKNLSKTLTLNDMCEITKLSPSQFSNIFKSYTGKTFIDYTNLVRCQYARSLFLTGKYTVTECAEMVGYNNLPYFARKYRQIFGETLSQTDVTKSDAYKS